MSHPETNLATHASGPWRPVIADPTGAIVGIVGAGTMGAGIAQLALENGHEVVLHDVDEAAIERGRQRIREGLARRAARLGLDADSIDDWVDGRLVRLRDGVAIDAVGAEADVVIEAALEDLDLKRTIFRALDAAARPGAVLATNTSALSVGEIASVTESPGRIIGLHFFNPAPVMALVEVVSHALTDPAAADWGAALVTAWGKRPVPCADSPGFIVNRVIRPFTLEALAMLERGEAGIEQIDGSVRAAGFPIGPFQLMDLVGIDVNLAAARGVFEGFRHRGDPLAERFRPSPIQERLVAAGRLGRKTGEGFYRYEHGGGRPEPLTDLLPSSDAGARSPRPALDDPSIADRLILGMIAEAFRAAADGTALPEDIDRAVTLGAGHPVGLFERIPALDGPLRVAERLRELETLGPRFAVPPSLPTRSWAGAAGT